ncbi:MAG: NAD(P)/FAD-dependent oxidoreductase [Methylotenera sp.]|uniref:NAD(P)/FAD-dependent oxidoreductase n=1 Tax=Methylotenera sp. TaxID=2051956 RepID=UPI002722E3F8|nr:NAD(P)/FAD-dependent oxidoreductase [Methylotenera sp.]MDO9394378.1 NAD(P)/FAD-dependent oxidoreductase [Methylotenera sp.]MDP1522267.1 NAD(P)/FAD-dependent oxidoreductase [Methylotenera sp.]MDP3308509.1 NAD(P)/FAD-dependent oxidoreductase [Methylotenera sp.]
MTDHFNRRDFIKAAGAASALLVGNNSFARATKPPMGRVVVVGGGYAGATAAKYLRMWSLGAIEVIVVEPNKQFVSCPLSNLVLGGSKSINDLTFGYDALKANHGIKWVQDTVTAIDSTAKKVTMLRGELSYDRLVVAPGVDFIYDGLPMLASAEAQSQIPHAWKAGWQTVNLRKQLEAMPDGGVFVMTIPKAPYRCPPGPYERVCQVASYFKAHKPKSKIIVLDANAEIISKKGLFAKVFNETYAGIVDYRPDNVITGVDVATKTITTDFDKIKAEVLNVIPPQRAGKIAQIANLTESDYPWCDVNFLTYESKLVPSVHVLGDSVAAGLPKSAHMASNQAKVCANAIVQLMAGQAPDPAPVFANTCYSYVTAKSAMHVANVYRYDEGKKIMVSAEGGGVSMSPSEKEGEYAAAWAQNIWADTLT